MKNLSAFFNIARLWPLLLIVGKNGGILGFLMKRAAGWSGSFYFWRRWRRTHKRRYAVMAIGIYVLSWLTVIAGSIAIIRSLVLFFRSL